VSLFVQKFGGTSVATVEHIQNVARRVMAAKALGHQVVVVVSAMGHETDRLDDLANSIDAKGADLTREVDVLLSTGEQVTTALLSMTLTKDGCPAKSYTGGQVKILTDESHSKARILDIDTYRLQEDLANGVVPVVAGFQGVDEHGDITTLGRGGSDTTAVALAAVLKADECQIFTDVEGVFTTDPRMVEGARCLSRVTFEEMLELASLGSKVLHTRAVEFASKYKIPIRVLSTFNEEASGTLITSEDYNPMEQPIISGIAFTRDEAKLTVLGVKDVPGIASRILGPISDANIEVDMIVQNVAADSSTDFTFTVRREDYEKAFAILEQVAADIGARVSGDNKIAKLSLVGVGMRSHAGVASLMFRTLSDESINIQMISTSEIKISVVVDEKYLELAARALHSAFELDAEVTVD
jgi:aspartate kinase